MRVVECVGNTYRYGLVEPMHDFKLLTAFVTAFVTSSSFLTYYGCIEMYRYALYGKETTLSPIPT